ncbi:MAG: hypothetical protein F9K15_16375 [Zoogloea sp.]|nr:MAG: hypothetical protein F9K15_16375 [Zoogloea sp.]
MSRNYSSRVRSFSRPILGPDGGGISLNENLSVSLLPGRAVVVKQGARIVAFYEGWTDELLAYIRDELTRIMLDPYNAEDPNWSALAE